MNRASGILLPIFSLPSRYGIGCFSKEAYEFVDMLKDTKQKFWQVLPMGPTGYGDSPYQSFSSFAGNPYFIDLEKLINEGLLDGDEEELGILDQDIGHIDYVKQNIYRFKLLQKAKKRFEKNEDFEKFCIENDFWLNEYCVYMALKKEFKTDFFNFPKEYVNFKKSNIDVLTAKYIDDVELYKFIQFQFYKQWFELKEYANDNGIEIIGDIPIYVSMDSAEVWLNRDELMDFVEGEPVMVAGCPPDAFSEDGQLWGNPIYNWEKMEKDNFSWWCKRFEISLKLFDYIRVDHFRGFDSYYCIPVDSDNAINGVWKNGPGITFFNKIKEYLQDQNIELNIIAEDLGFLTDSVKELLEETGFPGMKVIQFAFTGENSDYLNYNHVRNSVVYSGTHDNQTTVGWLKSMDEKEKNYIREYLGIFHREVDHWDIIRLAMSSVSRIAVIPMQDYLGLDDDARINEPGTLGANWNWRMTQSDISEDIISGIEYYTKLYGRAYISEE